MWARVIKLVWNEKMKKVYEKVKVAEDEEVGRVNRKRRGMNMSWG